MEISSYELSLKKIAYNDGLMNTLIHKINNSLLYFVIDEERKMGNPEYKEGIRFDDLVEKAFKPLRHYFTCGRCNIYSYILCKIFGDYASVYDNGKHIVTKIGNSFYDFDGINYIIESDEHLKLFDKTYLLEPTYSLLGNFDKEIDPIIINVAVNAGIKYIKEYSKELERKKIYK